jgi:ABC-2 type transport system ATP-binding protein
VIEINNLTKWYGTFKAVDGISFSVPKGEMFGFLGPNGAGKTTTIRMLMGVLVPSSGSITIDGKDSLTHRVEIKSLVGYLPENPIFYDFLKGREILRFVGEMHGQSSAEASENAKRLLEEFTLADAGEEYAVNYSMGMKKKLGLACAMIHSPKLLILDEPTNGLDPRASRDVQQRLEKFAADGGTVFLSTHLMEMAERLCHRIGVISGGKMAGVGSLAEIHSQIKMDGTLEDLFLKLTDTQQDDASVRNT